MQVDVFTQNTFQPISLMMEIVKIRARNNNDLIEPVLHVSGVECGVFSKPSIFTTTYKMEIL